MAAPEAVSFQGPMCRGRWQRHAADVAMTIMGRLTLNAHRDVAACSKSSKNNGLYYQLMIWNSKHQAGANHLDKPYVIEINRLIVPVDSLDHWDF